MGLFSFLIRELAIDLGTANTIIMENDKIVVDEPSIIARDLKSGKMVAIGRKAQQMHGRTHDNIITIRPLKDGVIADFEATEEMIRGMINMSRKKGQIFSPSLRVVVGIPSGSTEVERRAVRNSAEHCGAKEVYLIYEPMAAAVGIGLDVEAPEGNMVIDIGGGTSEIAVISLGGIVAHKSIRVAGDEFTSDIREHMRKVHNIRIFERTAEEIKKNVGSALASLDNPPPDYVVRGPHQMTALPVEIPVTYQEVAQSLDKSIVKIESAVMEVLENTPPELYADIYKNGINLTGGGALLRGLDKRLSEKTKLPVRVAEDPLHAVAHGTFISLKNVDKFPFLMRS
ncbi:MAG: rod shape-determining protein [Bacteroidales bacterium]|nr:rod shape-determining protein [Bacteroidales bacterium]